MKYIMSILLIITLIILILFMIVCLVSFVIDLINIRKLSKTLDDQINYEEEYKSTYEKLESMIEIKEDYRKALSKLAIECSRSHDCYECGAKCIATNTEEDYSVCSESDWLRWSFKDE